jgi:hypothetical protein
MSVPSVLPHHTGGGVAQVNWGVLQELRRRGHEALVVCTREKQSQAAIDAIRGIGADYFVVATGDLDTVRLHGLLARWKPDVIYSYSLPALLSFEACQGIPQICALGDLDHLVPLCRRQYYARSVPISYPELTALHQQAMAIKTGVMEQLRQCAAVTNCCYQHYKWYESMGLPNTFIPNTVADPFHKGWVRPLESYPTNPLPRVSMAGHLGGIATLSGLYFLAEDVMPWLTQADGPRCQIRIAGAEGLFPDIHTRLVPYIAYSNPASEAIKMLGYVDDIKAEMMDCEVSLVTTPIDLGVRTRIIDAWALGCCVVTHAANLAGFEPGELVHGVNCLIGSTGRVIVDCLKMALADPALRVRLGQAGRATYEKHHMDAPSKCVDLIEATARVKEAV